MMNILRSMESRHSSSIPNLMKTCNKCWQQFKHLNRHLKNDYTCKSVLLLREIIITTKIHKIKFSLLITVQILDLCFHAGVKFFISVAHAILTEEMIHRRRLS